MSLDLETQRRKTRQTSLDQYTVDELIRNLKDRKLDEEQALKLKDIL